MKIENLEEKIYDYLQKVSSAYEEDANRIFYSVERLRIKPPQLTLSRSRSFFDQIPDHIRIQTKSLRREAFNYKQIFRDKHFIENLTSLINDAESVYFVCPVESDVINNFKILWKMLIEAKIALNSFYESGIDEKYYYDRDRGVEKMQREVWKLTCKLGEPIIAPPGPRHPNDIAIEVLRALQDLSYDFKKSISPLTILTDTLGIDRERLPKGYKTRLDYFNFIKEKNRGGSSIFIYRIPAEFWDI